MGAPEIFNLQKQIYSTDEIKTNNVWIDGKAIYRKVLNITTFNNLNDGWYDNIDMSFVDNMISVSGFIKQNTVTFPINAYHSDSWYNCFYLNAGEKKIHGIVSQELQNKPAMLILEYTKITD